MLVGTRGDIGMPGHEWYVSNTTGQSGIFCWSPVYLYTDDPVPVDNLHNRYGSLSMYILSMV